MMRYLKIVFYIVFSSVFLILSGCGSDYHQPAPVVNAWYQKGAASHFYVVQSDDTIYSISFAFGLDYRDLVAVNHLSAPYHLTPGQRLIMTHRAPTLPSTESASPVVMPVYSAITTFNAQWNWPARGRIIQRFSRNPAGHPGVSIAGQLGEPIRASAGGVVVYSGDGVRGYGNLIIVKHNDSYLSAYAFNQQNLVRVGEPVRAGQIIARMGQNDAGRTLLYFEIRRNGVPVNPLTFLK